MAPKEDVENPYPFVTHGALTRASDKAVTAKSMALKYSANASTPNMLQSVGENPEHFKAYMDRFLATSQGQAFAAYREPAVQGDAKGVTSQENGKSTT